MFVSTIGFWTEHAEPTVPDNTWFDESTIQSQIKAEIVEKYFDTWAGIVTATQDRYGHTKRIGYVDLFAGPGRYKSGAISTPIRILQKAIEKTTYAERLCAIFNDKDDENIRSLESAIKELEGIDRIKHPPTIWHQEVGDKIAADFERINTIPLLAFVDPWGYKGLTLRLVNSFIKSWGCDCIFFFNYARINAGLSNPLVREHMSALFGEERADRLKVELEPMSPADREATIVNELSLALRNFDEKQKRFVLPFCFKSDSSNRTTHHLILVTKHFKGYDVMKEIMARYSSSSEQGVPSFTFSPATNSAQQLLFQLNRPLDDLRDMLLSAFAGKTKTMREVYEEHSEDRKYIAKNYKAVLSKLLAEGAITVDRTPKKAGTFADEIKITFPRN